MKSNIIAMQQFAKTAMNAIEAGNTSEAVTNLHAYKNASEPFLSVNPCLYEVVQELAKRADISHSRALELMLFCGLNKVCECHALDKSMLKPFLEANEMISKGVALGQLGIKGESLGSKTIHDLPENRL